MFVQAAWAAPATHLLTMPSPQVHRNLQADLTYLAHYKHAQDSRRQQAGFMDPRQRLSVTVHVQRVTRVASHACAVCKVAQVETRVDTTMCWCVRSRSLLLCHCLPGTPRYKFARCWSFCWCRGGQWRLVGRTTSARHHCGCPLHCTHGCHAEACYRPAHPHLHAFCCGLPALCCQACHVLHRACRGSVVHSPRV